MSKAELTNTKKTRLLRGGKKGKHYVTGSANRNAKKARRRLSLDYTPEVRVRMEVPSGKFSKPSKVGPLNNMPGGGIERTATGDIPVKILGVFK